MHYSDKDFGLNFEAKPEPVWIGLECEPVVVIDNALRFPERVATYADEIAKFGTGGASYPGLRAAVPEHLNRSLFYGLEPLAHQIFGVTEKDEMSMTTSFALVTASPERLQLSQRIPHYDSSPSKNLAVVIYLCGAQYGGTAFFRHKSTGYETVSVSRAESYNRRIGAELAGHQPRARFPDSSTPFFEPFHRVDARFNRLVLYRSRLLHSAIIEQHHPLSEHPREGRLTITSFMEHRSTTDGFDGG